MEDMHLKSTLYALIQQNSLQKILTWLDYANTWDYPIPNKYLLLTASISLKIISLMASNHNLFFTHWVSLKKAMQIRTLDYFNGTIFFLQIRLIGIRTSIIYIY